MFSFFKKRGAKPSASSAPPKAADDPAALEKERARLEEQLGETKDEMRVDLLNRLGEICFRMEAIDAAIDYYEASLAASPALGKAHGELLKLYNKKRRESAEAKDDAEVQRYMDKIDELMKLTKTAMRTI